MLPVIPVQSSPLLGEGKTDIPAETTPLTEEPSIYSTFFQLSLKSL